METLRCFIAVEMPQDVREALAAVQSALRQKLTGADSAGRALKWVDPEGVHLTLKFLGAVPSDQIPSIEDALRSACAGRSPFTIRLGAAGAFPSAQRARVLWVGLEGDTTSLGQLQQRVESELATLGYEPETRPFSPHLTLARVRDDIAPDDRRRIGELLEHVPPLPPGSFLVKGISLMRSQLSPSGARYFRLAFIPLADDR